jgi:hypothetical protein
MTLQPFVEAWPFLQCRNLFYTVGTTPWTGDQPVARPLPAYRTTQTQNKRIHISMLWVGFEPTIPAFERANIVHALDRAATLIGNSDYTRVELLVDGEWRLGKAVEEMVVGYVRNCPGNWLERLRQYYKNPQDKRPRFEPCAYRLSLLALEGANIYRLSYLQFIILWGGGGGEDGL